MKIKLLLISILVVSFIEVVMSLFIFPALVHGESLNLVFSHPDNAKRAVATQSLRIIKKLFLFGAGAGALNIGCSFLAMRLWLKEGRPPNK